MSESRPNFLEEDIAKYGRRVRMIKDNPDPKRPMSNMLYYELVLEERLEELSAWQKGENFVYFMGARPEIFKAMGFHLIWLDVLGDRMAGRQNRYFEIARNAGYTERSICDRLQQSLGLVLSGDLPPPAFIFVENCICDAITHTMLAIAHYCKAPFYAFDRYQEPGYDPIPYLLKQIEELIEVCERKVAGAKFNERKLLEIQKRESDAQEHIRRVWDAAKSVPCPITGREAFRIPELHLASRKGGVEYFKAYADEIEDRVRKRVSVVGQEKARVMWCVTGPFYADGFAPLEKRGISVPVVLTDTSRITCGLGPGKIDWLTNGKKLSPMEQEAELMTMNSWMAPAEKWVRDIIDNARDFSIDGIVYFLQTGCPTTLTSQRIVVDRVEKELGIPVLVMEGWMLDEEKFDRIVFEERLNEFADIVLGQKEEQEKNPKALHKN